MGHKQAKKARKLAKKSGPTLQERRQELINELQKTQAALKQAADRSIFLQGAIAALNDSIRQEAGNA